MLTRGDRVEGIDGIFFLDPKLSVIFQKDTDQAQQVSYEHNRERIVKWSHSNSYFL